MKRWLSSLFPPPGLPFHDDHRLQAHNQLRQTRIMHYVNNFLCVFVSSWCFLTEKILAMHANGHAACRQLVKQITRTDGLFRCGSALPAPCSVAARAEALLHRPL